MKANLPRSLRTGGRVGLPQPSRNFFPLHRIPAVIQPSVGHTSERAPEDFVTTSINDKQFIFREVFVDETYTKNTLISLRPGDTVIDIGANAGMFAVWAADRVGLPSSKLDMDRGRVLALEPVPEVFEALQKNAANLTYPGTVIPFRIAISDRDGSAALRSYSKASGWSSLKADNTDVLNAMAKYLESPPEGDLERTLPPWVVVLFKALPRPLVGIIARVVVSLWLRDYEDIVVETRTLSSFLRDLRIERVDLLKIDVERAELDVLRGLSKEDFRKKVRQVVAEVHEENLEEFVNVLHENGGFRFSRAEIQVRQDEALRGTGLHIVTAHRDEIFFRDLPNGVPYYVSDSEAESDAEFELGSYNL